MKNDKKQIICNLIEERISEKYSKYTFEGEIEVNSNLKWDILVFIDLKIAHFGGGILCLSYNPGKLS